MRFGLLFTLILALPALGTDKVTLVCDGLKQPFGLDFDEGSMIVAEYGGHRILKIDSAGKVSVIAGSGKKGNADGLGEKAEFNAPHNLVIAPGGIAYVADTSNHLIRSVNLKTGEVKTIAGTTLGDGGDGGPAIKAKFNQTYHVALDPTKKKLLIADIGNFRIRQIDLETGMISTVAGTGKRGVPKDGSAAAESPLFDPRAVAVDPDGKIYILERGGHAMRVVESGKIRTVAGTGSKGLDTTDGPGVKIKMDGPKYLWIDGDKNVLVADTENHLIRKYTPKDGLFTRIAGTGTKGKDGLDGPALKLQLNQPHGVAIDPKGNMIIADSSNGRILKVVKE